VNNGKRNGREQDIKRKCMTHRGIHVLAEKKTSRFWR